MEVIGYAFRALSSRKDPYRISYFVVEYFLIVTAPVFISASIYVCLTKLVNWAASEGIDLTTNRFLRKRFILWTFITVDVLTTLMQVAGAGVIGGETSKFEDPFKGNHILLAGLAMQTAAFTVYLALLGVVLHGILHERVLVEKTRSQRTPFLGILSVASILVYVRTIFRLVETSQGVFGFLSSHEAFFGSLEFAPIVLAI